MQPQTDRNDALVRAGETSLGELLLDLLRFYRRFGRLLLLPAVLLGALAAGWAAQHPLYRATAILDVPDLTLQEWREAMPLLWDRERLAAAFPQAAGDEGGAFARQLGDPAFWENRVQYRTSLRIGDVRDAPNADVRNTRVLGLEVSLPVVDAAQAQRRFELIGEQIRQALLWNNLDRFLRERTAEAAGRQGLQAKILEVHFDIEQRRQRIAAMQALLERYPQLKSMDASSVTSVQDGGGNYLAPLTQIVALEAGNAESEGQERQLRRDYERLDWYARLLGDARSLPLGARPGSQLLDYLRRQTAPLQQDAATPDVARQVAEEIGQRLDSLALRDRASTFKAYADIAKSRVWNRRPTLVGALVAAASLLGLSLLLGLHLALLAPGARPLAWFDGRLRRWTIREAV